MAGKRNPPFHSGAAVNRPYKEAGYAPHFRDKGARARQNWKRRRAAGRG